MKKEKQQENEIRELVKALAELPKEDRIILLSNANAFKVRNELVKANKDAVTA